MTPPAAVARDRIECPTPQTLFDRSRKLRTVQLDGYVDEHGVRHVMFAVFGDGTDAPTRWRVLDAVLVEETVPREPLEHAAHVAAMYVADRIEMKEGPR